jgi:hypothetical protein
LTAYSSVDSGSEALVLASGSSTDADLQSAGLDGTTGRAQAIGLD